MKKVICLFFILHLLLLIGCSTPQYDHKNKYNNDEDGNFMTTNENGLSVSIEQLPYEMNFNDLSITYSDAEMYMLYGEIHGKSTYEPFLVLKFDITQFSEDDIYWLNKESLFSIYCFITDELNYLEHAGMIFLTSYQNDKYMYYIFYMRGTYAGKSYGAFYNNFESAEILTTIYITQDEKNEDGQKIRNRYAYKYVIEGEIEDFRELQDQGDEEDELYQHIKEALIYVN